MPPNIGRRKIDQEGKSARGFRQSPPRWRLTLTFISQFVEIPEDVASRVEYSARAAKMAVYELLGIAQKVPTATPHVKSIAAHFNALLNAFK